MTATLNRKIDPRQARSNDRNVIAQLGLLGPDAIRAMAEQTREAVQRSFDAAGEGAAAFNRRMLDLAERNVISSFDLAKKLTEAKNLADVLALQVAYWQKQFSLTFHAEETSSLGISADLASPTKESRSRKQQVMRSMDNAKVVRVVNAHSKKQSSTDKKSIALAQSKVNRKVSGARSAPQREPTKRTSGHLVKQPFKGKK
jgi:hypothetical protein